MCSDQELEFSETIHALFAKQVCWTLCSLLERTWGMGRTGRNMRDAGNAVGRREKFQMLIHENQSFCFTGLGQECRWRLHTTYLNIFYNQANKLLNKIHLSSYLDRYTFLITCRHRSKFRVLRPRGILVIAAWGEQAQWPKSLPISTPSLTQAAQTSRFCHCQGLWVHIRWEDGPREEAHLGPESKFGVIWVRESWNLLALSMERVLASLMEI